MGRLFKFCSFVTALDFDIVLAKASEIIAIFLGLSTNCVRVNVKYIGVIDKIFVSLHTITQNILKIMAICLRIYRLMLCLLNRILPCFSDILEPIFCVKF